VQMVLSVAALQSLRHLINPRKPHPRRGEDGAPSGVYELRVKLAKWYHLAALLVKHVEQEGEPSVGHPPLT